MFFEDAREVEKIASKIGCGVFVMPRETKLDIKNAIILQPEDKSVITIEQVRGVIAQIVTKQMYDIYIIVRPADLLNDEAANALLKNLEEPREKVHFVLVTENPAKLLPTVLSRSAVYVLRTRETVDGDIRADEKTREVAKKLIVARGTDVVALAEAIAKKKDARSYALEVFATAIEMLYKSYFKTGKSAFIAKIPKFLKVYEGIAANGNVKLQIVAGLV